MGREHSDAAWKSMCCHPVWNCSWDFIIEHAGLVSATRFTPIHVVPARRA